LRRYKIDELPQLWNVLKGEMSVVGPRAEVEQFVLHYTPEQLRLLDGPPGLAGFSQLVYPHEGELLEGCSSPEDVYVRYVMPRKLAVDLQYETRRTFWSDLKLIAQLILLILGRTDHIDRSFQLPPSIKKTLSDIGLR
jgi:lipopolysaccharide/colanic/teichoic acid biosynthesis glycosyltransferase